MHNIFEHIVCTTMQSGMIVMFTHYVSDYSFFYCKDNSHCSFNQSATFYSFASLLKLKSKDVPCNAFKAATGVLSSTNRSIKKAR